MSIFDLNRIQTDCRLSHLEFHATLESTNILASELAEQLAEVVPALVLTENQTAGRGRGSHRWHATSGVLTFTLVLDVTAWDVRSRCLVSLAAGLGVQRAVEAVLQAPAGRATGHDENRIGDKTNVTIKWPNDVLFNGRKLCGILTELVNPQDQTLVVVGVGLNVNNDLTTLPPDVQNSATSLFQQTSNSFDLSDVLVAVVNSIQDHVGSIPKQSDQVISEVNAVHALAGKTVVVQTGNRRISGICEAIDLDGSLLISTDQGPERVVAGSIEDWF